MFRLFVKAVSNELTSTITYGNPILLAVAGIKCAYILFNMHDRFDSHLSFTENVQSAREVIGIFYFLCGMTGSL